MLYKKVAHVTSGLLMWHFRPSLDARVALFPKLSDRLLKIWLTQKLASLNTSAFFLTNYKPLGTANLTAVRDEIGQYRVKFNNINIPLSVFVAV